MREALEVIAVKRGRELEVLEACAFLPAPCQRTRIRNRRCRAARSRAAIPRLQQIPRAAVAREVHALPCMERAECGDTARAGGIVGLHWINPWGGADIELKDFPQ